MPPGTGRLGNDTNTFARTYPDAKNYRYTDSFGRDDLPLIAKLADQAHTFIFERLAEAKPE